MLTELERKIVDFETARAWRLSLRESGTELVFTNGVFDILHSGHVEYLARAREQGGALLVGLNSDTSTRLQDKAPGRPLNGEEDRALVLAGLSSVDRVLLFDEETPLSLILELKPDVLAKGADYELPQIVGAAEVLARGGRVQRIPLRPGRSTSVLIERILNGGGRRGD